MKDIQVFFVLYNTFKFYNNKKFNTNQLLKFKDEAQNNFFRTIFQFSNFDISEI